MSTPKWGVVATIKAPTIDVLNFAAYHLELGASEIAIFLDDCNPETAKALAENPKIRCVLTDEAHWQNTIGRRPKKHQVRQVRNASYYYRRAQHLDWVAHIDVDEFLCLDQTTKTVADLLAECPDHIQALRAVPAESLCTDGLSEIEPGMTYCKAKLPGGPEGKALEHQLYPNFGGLLRSGFVSHVAGKIMLRTDLRDVKFGIHRAFEHRETQIKDQPFAGLELCHQHIESWEKWLQIMEFRLSQGSYRAELEQSLDPASGRIQRHQLFTSLTEGDNSALRAFFEECCLATPKLRENLDELGYLRQFKLDLAPKRAKHFTNFA